MLHLGCKIFGVCSFSYKDKQSNESNKKTIIKEIYITIGYEIKKVYNKERIENNEPPFSHN